MLNLWSSWFFSRWVIKSKLVSSRQKRSDITDGNIFFFYGSNNLWFLVSYIYLFILASYILNQQTELSVHPELIPGDDNMKKIWPLYMNTVQTSEIHQRSLLSSLMLIISDVERWVRATPDSRRVFPSEGVRRWKEEQIVSVNIVLQDRATSGTD